MKVCIIGLGYVGLTLAVYLAKAGKQVHGVDISTSVLAELKKNKAHFYEKQFDEALSEVLINGTFQFSDTLPSFSEPTVYIVTVGTPIDSNKKVSLEAIKSVSNNLIELLKAGDLVVLRSTLKIGTTRNVVKPILDEAQVNYHLAFCPERTLEGCALEELATLPQIISGVDSDSLSAAKNFFEPVCRQLCIVHSVEEAEMAKLLNNSERDLMFALANEIAIMCDTKGLNAHRVIEAANYQYPRSNLKKPGLVGGPCLEKDPYILTESFQGETYQPALFMAGRDINESLVKHSLERLKAILDKEILDKELNKIAILGFAFKGNPPTGDTRGSLVFPLIDFLRQLYPKANFVGQDYLASSEEILQTKVEYSLSVADAIVDADLVILQNNHPSYKDEPWHEFDNKNRFIFDFWNQLKALDLPNYIALGTNFEASKAPIQGIQYAEP